MTNRSINASSPWAALRANPKDVLIRSYKAAGADNIGIVAAGVGFYAFLAMVPMIGAAALLYGLVVPQETVALHLQAIADHLPASSADLLSRQIEAIAGSSKDKQGVGLLISLGIALFGARKGAGAMITALNIAYNTKDERGFLKQNAMALLMTMGALMLAGLALLSTALLASLSDLLPNVTGSIVGFGKAVSYSMMMLVGISAATILYRYGPDRCESERRWLTPGAFITAVGWLLATVGFGAYVANFANYNATYGSLGAVIVLLTWLYLSAYILLLGAEVNAVIAQSDNLQTE
ncbi:YihY/virulence factor BrkB family protein [Altericroceibacterium endophyticum]|uniref:YihY/virulence factor BrkB family protein n=1 Tax=Altericroceibacterium endophyticum TaxID=1808508 RepID=UPI00301D05B2